MSGYTKKQLTSYNIPELLDACHEEGIELTGSKKTKTALIALLMNNQKTKGKNNVTNPAPTAQEVVTQPNSEQPTLQEVKPGPTVASEAEPVTTVPIKLIDAVHAPNSVTFKAIEAVKKFGKNYDDYLLNMLTQKIPVRQAELLYKKIATELGLILSTNQKKSIAKQAFLENDLSTSEGVDKVLSFLPEQIDLSPGGVKNWMKAFCEAKKITLAKPSTVSGPSAKTLEIFKFITDEHAAGKSRKAVIAEVVTMYGLKESTASLRYSKVSKENNWNISPADLALQEWALKNAYKGTKADIEQKFPEASNPVKKRTTDALAFFQKVIAAEQAAEQSKQQVVSVAN